MRLVLFCQPLVSDSGNARFLRGIVTELMELGHDVRVYEPVDGCSRQLLEDRHGPRSGDDVAQRLPRLRSHSYHPDRLDLGDALEGADVVVVHERNQPALVRRIGQHRRECGGYRLLFHDTHHRSVTAPQEMSAFDLSDYDGVLAFGEAVRQRYLDAGWAAQAWTWHQAADIRTFRPVEGMPQQGDLVWIGNWGDDQRTRELHEFLIGPVATLGLYACVHGVRYPRAALSALAEAGIDYRGWLPSHRVPAVYAGFRATVHVPRRPCVEALPGIPTIRMFEALACGIALVSAPWHDAENLLRSGRDYLSAADGEGVRRHLRDLLRDPAMARELRDHALHTVRSRHTCAQRVQELLAIVAGLGSGNRAAAGAARQQGRSLHA